MRPRSQAPAEPACYPGAVAQQGKAARVDVMADDRDARIAHLEVELRQLPNVTRLLSGKSSAFARRPSSATGPSPRPRPSHRVSRAGSHGGSAVRRRGDLTPGDLRGPGSHRHCERPALRGSRAAEHRAAGGTGAADSDGRGAAGHRFMADGRSGGARCHPGGVIPPSRRPSDCRTWSSPGGIRNETIRQVHGRRVSPDLVAEPRQDIAQTYRGPSRAHVARGMQTGARDRWAPGPTPLFMAASAARRR
jgi:hypothetical protein